MEFRGRVQRVLPMRSGTSQRTGSEWKTLPFVFEYFESDEQRWSDKVLLETFDTNLIAQIKEGIEVRIGFGHNIREYDGRVYNEVRMYKCEVLKPASDANVPDTVAETLTSQQEEEKEDDAPF